MKSHNVLAVVNPLLSLNPTVIKSHIQALSKSQHPEQHPFVINIFEQTYQLATAVLKSQVADIKAQLLSKAETKEISETEIERKISMDDQLPYFIEAFQKETAHLSITQLNTVLDNLNVVIDARYDFAEKNGGNVIGQVTLAENADDQKAIFQRQSEVGVRDLAIGNLQMALLDTLAVKQQLEDKKQIIAYQQFCDQHMNRYKQEIIKHLYSELKSFEILTLGHSKDMPATFSTEYDYNDLMLKLLHEYHEQLESKSEAKHGSALDVLGQTTPILNRAIHLIKKSEPVSVALEKFGALKSLGDTLIVPGISARDTLNNYKIERNRQLETFSKRRDSAGMRVFIWLAKHLSAILPASLFTTKLSNEVRAQEDKEKLRPGGLSI